MRKVRAAAVQATPVFLSREATVNKAVKLIHEAGSQGAGLIVFPETFIPTYPDWVWRATPWDGPSGPLYGRLLENSVIVPSAATDALGRASRRVKAYVSVGVNEREERASTASSCPPEASGWCGGTGTARRSTCSIHPSVD